MREKRGRRHESINWSWREKRMKRRGL